ncbi:hypothetical protein AB0F07_25105 [Streptomyces fructofermentans]|uniref:hypothetical protein n=1 Tax=Streptomyces fructofermentans TaxID=152141 RepID=UPI0033E4E81B
MPRRPARGIRGGAPGSRSRAISSLLIGVCPGPPACSGAHTQLFVDGLDLVARSRSGAAGLCPCRLLRPGGPLHPSDAPRTVRVASPPPLAPPFGGRPDTGPDHGCGGEPGGLDITVRLRGELVVWADLMFPDDSGRVVEEVRFRLGPYLGEIGRVYARWKDLGSGCGRPGG